LRGIFVVGDIKPANFNIKLAKKDIKFANAGAL
jgi:hypothetical protein